MTTYTYSHPIDLKGALTYGPEMLLFYLLFIVWIIVFGMHLKNISVRFWTSKVLLGLTALIGLLAPIHTSIREFSRSRMLSLSGVADPLQWAHGNELIHLGSFLIALTAAMLTLLTVWAWLMPSSNSPKNDPRSTREP